MGIKVEYQLGDDFHLYRWWETSWYHSFGFLIQYDKNRSVQKSIEGLSKENAYLKQQEKPEKYPKTNIQNYA